VLIKKSVWFNLGSTAGCHIPNGLFVADVSNMRAANSCYIARALTIFLISNTACHTDE
jgi:hypothetical protein